MPPKQLPLLQEERYNRKHCHQVQWQPIVELLDLQEMLPQLTLLGLPTHLLIPLLRTLRVHPHSLRKERPSLPPTSWTPFLRGLRKPEAAATATARMRP